MCAMRRIEPAPELAGARVEAVVREVTWVCPGVQRGVASLLATIEQVHGQVGIRGAGPGDSGRRPTTGQRGCRWRDPPEQLGRGSGAQPWRRLREWQDAGAPQLLNGRPGRAGASHDHRRTRRLLRASTATGAQSWRLSDHDLRTRYSAGKRQSSTSHRIESPDRLGRASPAIEPQSAPEPRPRGPTPDNTERHADAR